MNELEISVLPHSVAFPFRISERNEHMRTIGKTREELAEMPEIAVLDLDGQTQCIRREWLTVGGFGHCTPDGAIEGYTPWDKAHLYFDRRTIATIKAFACHES